MMIVFPMVPYLPSLLSAVVVPDQEARPGGCCRGSLGCWPGTSPLVVSGGN